MIRNQHLLSQIYTEFCKSHNPNACISTLIATALTSLTVNRLPYKDLAFYLQYLAREVASVNLSPKKGISKRKNPNEQYPLDEEDTVSKSRDVDTARVSAACIILDMVL